MYVEVLAHIPELGLQGETLGKLEQEVVNEQEDNGEDEGMQRQLCYASLRCP